jgi:hypothetical protein
MTRIHNDTRLVADLVVLFEEVRKDHDLCRCLIEAPRVLEDRELPKMEAGFTDEDLFPFVSITLPVEISTTQAFGAGLSLGAVLAEFAAKRGYKTVIGGVGEGDFVANPCGLSFVFVPDTPEYESLGN